VKQAVAFVLASCAHGTVILNRLDWRPLSETHNEFGVGSDILAHGAFDYDLISMLGGLLVARREELGPGVTALDCGANIGIYTIEWSRLMDGWGQVIAFEPQQRIFYALAGNIAINNLFNAHAFMRAVGAEQTVTMMPAPDYQQPGQFGGLNLKGQANIGQKLAATAPVEIVTIDSLGLRRVDFIKVDVEGMELEALKGAHRTIERNHPYLLVEWHISGKAPIESFLGELGYETVSVGMNLICGPRGDRYLANIRGLIEGATESAA
jgi:FkbM family methyltransferase